MCNKFLITFDRNNDLVIDIKIWGAKKWKYQFDFVNDEINFLFLNSYVHLFFGFQFST